MALKTCGIATCGCGRRIMMQFADGEPSPAYFKTWCADCGVILEGRVELRVEEVPDDSSIQYLPLSLLRSKQDPTDP